MNKSSGDEERKAEEHEAKEHGVPAGEIVYRSVRQDGDEALTKDSGRLVWSGVAAGLSMGFSFAAEGLLRAHLPEAQWTPLITKLGYSLGFVIVVLGRQHLYTEQTLSAVLPVFSRDRAQGAWSNLARLWIVVLLANMAGVTIFAAAATWTETFQPDVHVAFSKIGHEAMSQGFAAAFVRAIYAGFLIATMIWLVPGSGESRLAVIVVLTYPIGLAGFPHIIAGSSECIYLVLNGERLFSDYLINYFVPTLAGNTLGGTVLVASLAHAQHAPEESR
jgi:formate-nitrite transporter family protein